MKNLLIVAAMAALAGFGGFFAYQALHGARSSGADGSTAPELQWATLDGSQLRLSELRGKLVLVNFWATWCAPCLKEIPVLVDAQDRFGPRGLQIIGPAMDDPEQIRAMLGRLKIQYPVLVGELDVSRSMDALGDTLGALPFSVLIAPDGAILMRKHGEFEAAELADLIEPHLPGV